jgi:hypothetical protein
MLDFRLLTYFSVAALLIPAASRMEAQKQSTQMAVVKKYLNAKDLETALSCLAEDYRIWFEKKEGEGIQRNEAEKMLQWDFALRPNRPVQHCFEQPGRVLCKIHEDNDFSRLIDFPGWEANTTYWINEDGLIMSQLYVTALNQPEWRPYLDKAIPWLTENRPEELHKILPDGLFSQSPESAHIWVEVLTDWRKAAGLPDVEK